MDPQLLMSLLAAQNGGALPAGMEDPHAALAQMSQSNPRVAAILKMMEAHKAAAAAAREPEVIEGTAVEVDLPEQAAPDAQLDAILQENKLLRDRCDTLAAALGACSLCWGEDRSCRACRGHGMPGHRVPDQQLFCEFVVPAVRLVHASRQRSNHVASRTESTPMHLSS